VLGAGGALVVAAVVIITLLIVTLWAHDVWKERRHTVRVESKTPVYAGSGDESCGRSRLIFAEPPATFRVQRIRYWKNCATVDVVVPGGQKGYIVLGDGEVSINPPLDR
jgi:hypothetical protein